MSLSKEIIKRILADVGAVPSDFGKAGLTLPIFKLDKKFVIDYTDEEREQSYGNLKEQFHMYAGEGSLPGIKIRALLVDLRRDVYTDEGPSGIYIEYALALRVDDKPIYALRLGFNSYEDRDNGDFFIQEGENWISPTILIKSLALVGMETIVDQGMIWNPLASYKDLYNAVSHVVEMYGVE